MGSTDRRGHVDEHPGPPERRRPFEAGDGERPPRPRALGPRVDAQHPDAGLALPQPLGQRVGGVGDERHAPDQPSAGDGHQDGRVAETPTSLSWAAQPSSSAGPSSSR